MDDSAPSAESDVRLPRVSIQFCTQCKWNLRAAYFAQELLQTFSTTLGEVSLQPSTGGVFKVDITYSPPSTSSSPPATTQRTTIWDRSTDGGFPETKELKRRVRDIVSPGRNLGHVDKDYAHDKKDKSTAGTAATGDGAQMPDEAQTGGGSSTGAAPSLPRPRDIAAKAGLLTHPPDVAAPVQHEWGSRESDRVVPAGVGGTKPVIPVPPSKREHKGKEGSEVKEKEGVNAGKECGDCE